MVAESMRRVAIAFARSTARPDGRLCTACIDVLEVSGAGITLMGGDQSGLLCVSSERVRVLEDLQYTTGQGPCREAFDQRVPILAPHMDEVWSTRWPVFASTALASGIGGVFAYPLSSVGAMVGVLTLYQDAAGALTESQHEDTVVLAEILSETLLSLQDDVPEGMLAKELDEAVAYRAQIHQAAGMVAIQLQVSTDEALVRIRAHAFADDVTLESVAAAIVARRLRLDDDRPQSRDGG